MPQAGNNALPCDRESLARNLTRTRFQKRAKYSSQETIIAQRSVVWTRYLLGQMVPQIRAELGLLYFTVRSIIQRVQKSDAFIFKSAFKSGRPKKTSVWDKWHLLQVANTNIRAILLALTLLSKSKQQLEVEIIRNIIKDTNKAKYKFRRKSYLKAEYKAGRRV